MSGRQGTGAFPPGGGVVAGTEFAHRVLAAVRRLRPGQVATYGEIAARAGSPGAARAVGNIMRSCGRPDVPCHRVIAAGGRLGGYGGDEHRKRALLAAEGVQFRGTRVVISRGSSGSNGPRNARKPASRRQVRSKPR